MKLPDMQECVHWRGMQDKVCGAGIDPRTLVAGEAGWVRKIPCIETPAFPRLHGGRACEKHVWATEEQRLAKFADVIAVDEAVSKLPYAQQRRLASDSKAFDDFVAKVLRERA